MATTNSVNHAISTNNNAPTLGNDWGQLTGLLDAVLVNGYSIQTISSISSNVEGEITATFGTSHNYHLGQILLITGANNSIFNGRFSIKSLTSNSVTFKEIVSVSQTTTGTITAKVAPFGYEIHFSDTNKRVYKSLNTDNGLYYIVDDALWSGYTSSYGKLAACGMATDFDQATGVITGFQCPYNPDNPNQNWTLSGSGASVVRGWAKWFYRNWSIQDGNAYYTSNSPGGDSFWQIVGNDEFIYLGLGTGTTTSYTHRQQLLYGFGKYSAINKNNTTNYFLSANVSSLTAGQNQSLRSSLATPDFYMPTQLMANEDGSNIGQNYAYSILPNAGGYAASAREHNNIRTYNDSVNVDLTPILLFSKGDSKVIGQFKNLYAPFGSQVANVANHGNVVAINGELFVLVTYYCGSGTGLANHQSLVYVKLGDST